MVKQVCTLFQSTHYRLLVPNPFSSIFVLSNPSFHSFLLFHRAAYPGVYAKIGSNLQFLMDTVCSNRWNVEADFCPVGQEQTQAPTQAPVTETCGVDEFLVDWRFNTDKFG